MLIKCPNCAETCETETEIAAGQHVVCPFCEVKFAYDEGCRMEPFKTLPLKPIPLQDVSYCASGLRLIRQRPLVQEGRPREMHSSPEVCEAIPNHLVGAIILCVFLLPAGVAALIFALQVDERKRDGDISRAKSASKTAGTIVKVGTTVAIAICVAFFLYFLIIGMVVANKEQKMMHEINNVIDAARSIQYDL